VYLSFRFFLEGAEEFFIQPTAWYYMKYLGESNVFLGLTLAAYSTASFIFSPIIGIFQMKYQASKGIVLIFGLIKFSGNLLYSIPVNGYFPLFGRFISGIGEGSLGVLFGVVSKATNNKNRAKAYIYFNGLWGIGSVFGPMIGSGLTFNVNVLGWEINAGNSPAIVVAIVWFLLLILATFLPSDLAENSQVEEIEEDEDSDENDDEHSETRGNICCNSSTVFCLYYLIFLRTFVYNAVSFYTPLRTSSVPSGIRTQSREVNLPERRIVWFLSEHRQRSHLGLGENFRKEISFYGQFFYDYPNINYVLLHSRVEQCNYG
jgi:MFS family permease